jgi:hypothetical protein
MECSAAELSAQQSRRDPANAAKSMRRFEKRPLKELNSCATSEKAAGGFEAATQKAATSE